MSISNVYLDHNSTTNMSNDVLNKIIPLMSVSANASAIHWHGRAAKGLVEDSRRSIMASLNIDPLNYDVIFTSSGTESNNMVLKGFAGHQLFILSTEHLSIIKVANLLGNVTFLKVDAEGMVDLDYLRHVLNANQSGKEKLVSIGHANNETGVVQDIKTIAEIVHNHGAILHSDMIQSFGKIECDLQELGVDIATISSHKIGGMQGAAAVIKKATVFLPALLHGGGQERGFRAGTENVCAIASFGEAAKLIENNIKKYEEIKDLRDYLESSLFAFEPNIKIYSKNSRRLPNTTYIAMPSVDNQTQLINFDLKGFSVSTGSACSSGVVEKSHVLKAMNDNDKFSDSAIRISLGINNTQEEIQNFISAWKNVYTTLKK